MNASNLELNKSFFDEHSLLHLMEFSCSMVLIPSIFISSIPELWVQPEAEAVSDTSRSPLPLEGAGFGDERFHQGTHLAALMVPEQ